MLKVPYACLTLLLVLEFTACKKDSGMDQPNQTLLLTKVANDYNSTINIFYDHKNRPFELTWGFQAFWVDEYDAKGNITRMRDTGYSGGFGTGSYINAKTTFEYDGQNRIIKSSYYEHSPFFADSTKPISYNVFSYVEDTIIRQGYAQNPLTGEYNKPDPDYIERIYLNADRNLESLSLSDDSDYTGHPFHFALSANYANTQKNPLLLLPRAIVIGSPLAYLEFDETHHILSYSKFIPETMQYVQEAYEDYFSSMMKRESLYSNSLTMSSLASGYPESIHQTINYTRTNLTTGEVFPYTDSKTFRFEYVEK